METVKFGRTGLDVSPICLGAMSFGNPENWIHDWVLNEEDSRQIIRKSLDLGIDFFDTANIYSKGGSERILGRALKDFADREDIVVATKLFSPMRDRPNGGGLSRKAIMHEIDQSLDRLGMDYVDLYIIHRWDYNTPIEETMEALHDVVKSGKARYIGASAMYAWQFQKAQYVAEKKGVSRSQVALAWLLHKPQVVAPIIGATKEKYLDDAAAALEIVLTKEEMDYLEEVYTPHEVTGPNPYTE